MKYITSYNPNWPHRFAQIAAYLTPYLPVNCKFHHVGSTSVPGMPAKDIIDLDIEYEPDTLKVVLGALNDAGYEHEGDLGITGREAFKPTPGSVAASLPVHNLYACQTGANELRKHLAYRNYLIAHPARAQWLANQKILVDAAASSRDDYIKEKSPYYDIINQEAEKWA